ncbi:hypothetical protein [Ralstonia solanacearum]|nr:hypothetical protein [Ralstonia solanacearum]
MQAGLFSLRGLARASRQAVGAAIGASPQLRFLRWRARPAADACT